MKRRNWLSGALCVALALAAMGCSGSDGGSPTAAQPRPSAIISFPFVIRVEPAAPAVAELGGTLRVLGNNFGAAPGTVRVTNGGSQLAIGGADVVKWTNDEIVVKLPTRDAAGNPILSTASVIGSATVSVTRADGTDNPTNTDAKGTVHPAAIQLASVGKIKVTIDKGGDFASQSLEYTVMAGNLKIASFATPYSNGRTFVDLEHLFNLPARADYQVFATLYSGPVMTENSVPKPTGDVILQTESVAQALSPAETKELAVPVPCKGYLICYANPNLPGATPAPSSGGGVPAPTPNPGATSAPIPTPAPTASPPPGVTPESIVSYGVISTAAGKGATKNTPPSRAFNCTANDIGQPWSVAVDSSKVVHFASIFGMVGKVKSASDCESIIINEPVAGFAPSILQTFTFSDNDTMYLTDSQLDPNKSPRWRVVEVKKKVDGTYDVANAANLSFGSIALEAPTSVHHYKNKLYVTSSDEDFNGSSQSYVVEYDLASKSSRIVAGSGTAGFAGDGGAAVSARISASDTGFGPVGSPYEDLMVIADTGTNALRAVNLRAAGGASINFHGVVIAPGNIGTIVGQNSARHADLVGAPNDGLGFSNYAYRAHDNKQGGFSGDGNVATEALISWPFAPRFDKDGRLYFIDADNHRIRVIDRAGIIHTVSGTSAASNYGCRGFGSPGGKNIDVATRQYTIPNGDGGGGNLADLNHPMDMVVLDNADGSVDIVLAETDSYRVRRIAGLRWQ